MIYDSRVYIDNTILKSALSCSLQMVLRHVLNWNSIEDSVHLRAGQAMHEAQAAWNYAIIQQNVEEQARVIALNTFETEYKAYSDAWVEPDNRLNYDNLRTILDEWFLSRFGKLPWIVPDARLIEVGFAYPLTPAGDVLAFGRYDLIAQDARDLSWVVVDHKSTGRIDLNWTDAWALDSQISHYYWAALQHVPNVRGFYINGIQFSKLPGSDRKCTAHGLKYSECSRYHMEAKIVGPVDRSPELLNHWYADALRGAEKYRYYATTYDPAVVGTTPDLSNVEMEGPFTGACLFCTFKDWCRTGQNVNALPLMYQQETWAPYDPREFEEKESPVKEVLGA